MTDYAKRLRACKTYEQGDAPTHMRETNLGKKAADEIERLIEVCLQLEEIDIENHADEIKKLREKNSELKEEVEDMYQDLAGASI